MVFNLFGAYIALVTVWDIQFIHGFNPLDWHLSGVQVPGHRARFDSYFVTKF